MNNKLIYLARRAQGVSREDWPKTWKSHAIFASQFPVIASTMEWLRYGNRVDQPTLDGEPVDLPMLSTAHDGVANMNSGAMERAGAKADFPPEIRAKLDEDELRVFDRLVKEFSFTCVEEPLREGLPGKAALYIFLQAGNDVSREDFDARWDGKHAELARQVIEPIASIKRYGHNHPVGDLPELFPFSGIVEIWFETQDDAVHTLSDGTLDPVLADLGAFSNMGRSVMILTTPCHAYPKDEVLLNREQEQHRGG